MENNQKLKDSFLKRCFIGKNGFRSGWILVFFILVYAILTFIAQFLFNATPALKQWAAAQPKGVITPFGNIAFTGLELLVLILSVKLISLIDKKSFSDYALPLNKNVITLIFKGLFTGLIIVSVLIGLISIFGGYSLGGLALNGISVIKYGILYAIGFFIVGVFEEFAFRGFLQSILQRSIGFWPAAIVLSLVFGAMHLSNSGELWIGALLAVCFGLLASLSLKLTGNIWYIIGVHAAFDWSNGFLFSSPIAGQPIQGHLFNAAFHGPIWLTGGSVGPQGSIFAFVVLAITALTIKFTFSRSK